MLCTYLNVILSSLFVTRLTKIERLGNTKSATLFLMTGRATSTIRWPKELSSNPAIVTFAEALSQQDGQVPDQGRWFSSGTSVSTTHEMTTSL